MAGDLLRADVAVVGGGPAGLATAIELRRQGLAVIVIERTGYDSPRVGEHVAPGAKALIAALGLKDAAASGQHASCPGIRSLWGSDVPVDRDYLFHPNGEGLNLSRPLFDVSLATVAEQLGVTVVTNARIDSLLRSAGLWHAGVHRAGVESQIRASVVVDATGRAATIAKRLGGTPIVYDELIGIVGRIPSAVTAANTVIIEALERGWWYSAGLADGSVVVTFMTDPELTDTSIAARARLWNEQLGMTRLTAARIAGYDENQGLLVRTARTQRLDEPVGDAWLAVGDAAMSFDPLSSEGISKGLEWGKKAAAAVAALCRNDRSTSLAYRDEIDRTFSEYLLTRYRYYAAEVRWPDAPFWRRRLLPPKPVDTA